MSISRGFFIHKQELSRNEKIAFIIGQIWALKDWQEPLYYDHGSIEKRILRAFENSGIAPPASDSPVEHVEKALKMLRDYIKLEQ